MKEEDYVPQESLIFIETRAGKYVPSDRNMNCPDCQMSAMLSSEGRLWCDVCGYDERTSTK